MELENAKNEIQELRKERKALMEISNNYKFSLLKVRFSCLVTSISEISCRSGNNPLRMKLSLKRRELKI